jgi:hypothetical protein
MKRTGSALIAGLALMLCASAYAADPKTGTQEVMFAGVKVGIDAKTGRLRPLTADESRQLDQKLTQGQQPRYAPNVARSFKAPATDVAARSTARPTAHGGVSVKVPESQMVMITAHRDADGAMRIVHGDDAAATQDGGLPNE